MGNLLLAYYGDDFTGSTDAMEALTTAGVRTVLFVDTPDRETLREEFSDVDAIGIAGTSRSMTPEEMDDHLPSTFESLNNVDAPIVHYKVCSTFDSSPEIGSIGHAIDIGQDVFISPYVPVVVGAPELGRYVLFGNHFATLGGTTYRLDRHPVMSSHPVTPMAESDLRIHLSEQTEKSIGIIDVLSLSDPTEQLERRVEELWDEIVVFDTLDQSHLTNIGRVLWEQSTNEPEYDPLFVIGSSGVEYALANFWNETNRISGSVDLPELSAVETTAVMSGSASPITRGQIEWALENGFSGVRIDTSELIDPEQSSQVKEEAIAEAVDLIEDGESVVFYTALGPDDPYIERTKQKAQNLDINTELGREIGTAQADILRQFLSKTELQRVCIAGGDTCGFVTPNLDIYALEVLSPTAPGSPLCKASAETEQFDDLQIALKGGQLGQTDYFGRIRNGK